METMSSSEFRKTYAKLTEPTMVTVNGHVIGLWRPSGTLVEQRSEVTPTPLTKLPGGGVQARQAQRDALLGKINRSK